MNYNCDALRDLVPFVQFKKRKKHPWMKPATFLKLTLLLGCFSRFLNCTNGTKLRNAPQLNFPFCILFPDLCFLPSIVQLEILIQRILGITF